VTPGRFTLPGAVAEDMYRPDTFARTSSRTIEVGRRS
jgi:alpha-2-macroglobulin